MTREEALSILKSILADLQRGAKDTDNVSCCLEYGFITYGKAKDCIKALEQEPCEDAISRQEVLYLIANDDLSMGQVVRAIHAMPPVTPQEPRWILVSERLPEAEYGESDSVLVCFENGTQDVLYFNGSNWCYPTGEIYISVNHKNGWHNKVIAWMPSLPRPFEPQESEG